MKSNGKSLANLLIENQWSDLLKDWPSAGQGMISDLVAAATPPGGTPPAACMPPAPTPYNFLAKDGPKWR